MIQQPSTTPVFILAGGAGERLSPLTQSKPKPAVSFGGTHQIIDFTLSNCINSGLRKIFVLTQYQREPLHDYVRQSRVRMSQTFRWHEGDELRPVPPVTGKHYRGTADAVFQNLPLLRFDTAEHVLITSGDHIYSMDYRALIAHHAICGAELTIASTRVSAKEACAFGVLEVENGAVTGFREKPSAATLPEDGGIPVNMGVYVFRRRALLDIADCAAPMETDFGRDIIPKLIRKQKVSAYDFASSARRYWRDVGSLDSYFKTNMELLAAHPEIDLGGDAEWPVHALGDTSLMRTRDSRVSRGSIVVGSTVRRSIVSRGACIEPGATVEDSIVLPGARVGRNARLRKTIVAEGATVPEDLTVGFQPSMDLGRFKVTPDGIVIVDTPLRRPSERSLHAAGPRTAVAVA
jgi:glucose-1-phosphate adenylyltransferase